MEVQLVFLSFFFGLVSSQIGELQNVAGKAGDTNVSLNGLVSNTEQYVLTWQTKPWDSTGNPQNVYTIIGGGSVGDIQDPFREEFEVRLNELHSLYAKNLKWANAGMFVRSYTSSAGVETEYGDLVTVGEMQCPETRVYDVGDIAQLFCSVDYTMTNADKDGPVLQWYRDGYEVETIPEESVTPAPGVPRTANYSHTFKVEAKHDQAVFECCLQFTNNINGKPPPVYRDNCAVSFEVRSNWTTEIDFTPDPGDDGQLDLNVGDVITCKANGDVEPFYFWTIAEGNDQDVFIKGEQLVAKDTMTTSINRYNCTAMQNIDGEVRSMSREVKFTVGWTSEIDFTPDPGDDGQLDLNVGDVITCKANGNPEPHYFWTIAEGKDEDFLIEGQQLVAKDTMTSSINRYNCTAIQNIGSEVRRKSREVKFTVEKGSELPKVLGSTPNKIYKKNTN